MNLISILALGLPLTALLAGWILLIAARKWNPVEPPAAENPPVLPPGKRSRNWKARLRAHAGTLTLAGILLLLILFLLVFAPPRLTGEIPVQPNLPGRPFYSLRWLRAPLAANADLFAQASTILFSLTAVAILVRGILRRSRQAIETGLLVAALTVAGLGQWTASEGDPGRAWQFYAVALAGFVTWAWSASARLLRDLEPPPAIPRGLEAALLVLLLGGTAYARLYALASVPYGAEGDETKWTAEAINVMIDGTPDTAGEYHRDALPVSYYMQAPFHRILGPGLFAVRLEVALVSILATLLFYWLCRQVGPLPLALLAAYLMSGSIFDITASRLGHVESHVKLWPVLALALLALAIKTRSWQVYALSGIALALGLLTYDTVWPLLTVILILAGVELGKKGLPARQKAAFLAALLAPTLMALPLLIPYGFSRWGYYNLSSKGWGSETWGVLVRNFKDVILSWFVMSRADFVYSRPGPLLNALLLPWLALGFTAAWFTLRRRIAGWSLVWALLFLFPVPVLAASPIARVYYPGLPAVYLLVALGMYLFWQELARLMGNWKTLAAVSAGVFLAWLPLLNLFIYFNEIAEPLDRVVRREVGELAGEVAGPGTLILLPVVPDARETLVDEYQIIEMYMHERLPADQIRDGYRYVPLDQLLPSLATDGESQERLEIILDRDATTRRAERDQVAAALQACYPGGTLTVGDHFDLFSLERQDLENAACLPVRLELADNPAAAQPSLDWQLSSGNATALELSCQRDIDAIVWFEAENAASPAGWRPETTFAEGWSGSGFLMDDFGSISASYPVALPEAPSAYAWVRYYKRRADHSPAYLSLGNQSFPFANAADETLDAWNWVRLGPYHPQDGTSEWVLARPFQEEQPNFMALFVDTLVFTTDPQYDPLSGRLGEAMPALVDHFSASREGTIRLGYPPGRYRCQATLLSPQTLVDAYGNAPVRSDMITVEIP